MKLTFIFFLFISILTCGQKPVNIVIMHPTLNNIKNYLELIDKKCIDVTYYSITGVYHSSEIYDYTISEKYISDKQLTNIKLIAINKEITPTEVYRTNALTGIFKSLVDSADVIFFNGGPDIPPLLYNQPTHFLTVIEDPNRHLMEVSFLYHLVGKGFDDGPIPLLNNKKHLPVWCFCLGVQSLNIAAGGTLTQDIPYQLYNIEYYETMLAADSLNIHKNYESGINPLTGIEQCWFHPLYFLPDNRFSDYFGVKLPTQARVYSYHHQCIDKTGVGIIIAATSADGKVPEIVYHKNFPNVWGFQFHPENSELYNFSNTHEPYLKNIANFTFDSISMDFHIGLWKALSVILNK